METAHAISFGIYIALIFFIGIFCHKKQKTSHDFIMGNRSLNYWVTAFSAHASDMSGWLFMAFPAAIFLGGLPQIFIALGLILGMFLNWQFVAKKLRLETEKYDSYTLSSYFENKFSDTSGILRILTALMAIIYLTFYLSAGLIALGMLLESLFQINYYVGLSIAMFVAMTYTFIGGYYTVAKVDQFQAIFLLIMIVFVPIVTFINMENPIEMIKSAAIEKQIPLHLFEANLDKTLAMIFLVLSWGLGYFGQPHIITKFMGINSPDDIKKSKYVGMTWQIITLSAAALIGLLGIGYFKGNLGNPELVFVNLIHELFNPLIGGFILCGILAATISTMDSQILVCSSILSEDFYKHMFKKHASQKELLVVSRIGVIIVSIFSLILAYMKTSSVLDAVLYAWSGLGASFGPLILMSLYFKRCNRYGAIMGIIVGGLTAGIWTKMNTNIPYDIPAMIPAFFLSLLTIYFVSIATNKKVLSTAA